MPTNFITVHADTSPISANINGEEILEPPMPPEPSINSGLPYDEKNNIQSETILENDEGNFSSPWLYVCIGIGVVAVAVSSIFVVKAIKRKKQQK